MICILNGPCSATAKRSRPGRCRLKSPRAVRRSSRRLTRRRRTGKANGSCCSNGGCARRPHGRRRARASPGTNWPCPCLIEKSLRPLRGPAGAGVEILFPDPLGFTARLHHDADLTEAETLAELTVRDSVEIHIDAAMRGLARRPAGRMRCRNTGSGPEPMLSRGCCGGLADPAIKARGQASATRVSARRKSSAPPSFS